MRSLFVSLVLAMVLISLVAGGCTGGPKITTIEDTASAFSWTGNWEKQNNAAASREAWHVTPPQGQSFTAGATATVTFTGTQVSLVYASTADYGIADISIDGTAYSPVDMYSALTETKVKKVIATKLSEGQHLMTITATGRKNPASTGYAVVIDAIEVSE